MSIIALTGFETGDFLDTFSSAGGVSIQSSVVRTGTYALKVLPGTTTQLSFIGLTRISAATGQIAEDVAGSPPGKSYVRFYFRVATAPGSGSEPIFSLRRTAASQIKVTLALTSARTLEVRSDTGNTLRATGTTVLALNTWYCIELYAEDITPTSASKYELRINSKTELIGTAEQGTHAHGTYQFGRVYNLSSQNVEFYYDDIFINDTRFVGQGKIVALKPRANGSTQQFTGGTGASDYQEVDEVPVDTTSYVQSPASASVGLFLCTQFATAGARLGVNGLMLHLLGVRENVAGTSSIFARIKSGASNVENGTGQNPSTTPVDYIVLSENEPATGRKWAQPTLDAAEFGIREAAGLPVRLSSVLVQVDCENAIVAAGCMPAAG